MAGFISWLQQQSEFKDLAEDSRGCRTLRGVIAEMDRCSACDEAWNMLRAALYVFPSLPDKLPRDLFTPNILWVSDVADALRTWARCPPWSVSNSMSNAEFANVLVTVRACPWAANDLIENLNIDGLQRAVIILAGVTATPRKS